MTPITDLEISTLRADEMPIAAALAGRAMRDNPSSIALFGDDPVHRLRAAEHLYHWVLSSVKRPPLVVRRNGFLVGLAALAPPDQCFYLQLAAHQRTVRIGSARVSFNVPHVPRNLLVPLARLGPRALSRLSTWGEAGAAHDPPQRHQHVELVVVDAAVQGMGIGRFMMEALCREIDKLPDSAYLETDKPENVRFYQHFGFAIIAEATVLGTTSWYMERNHPLANSTDTVRA